MIGIIYETIKNICEKQGLSISALEKKAGIGNGVIRAWAEGMPRVDILKKVADALGVSLDDIVNGNSND